MMKKAILKVEKAITTFGNGLIVLFVITWMLLFLIGIVISDLQKKANENQKIIIELLKTENEKRET